VIGVNNYYVYFTLVNDSIGEEVQLDAKSIEEAREFIQGRQLSATEVAGLCERISLVD
jgi:hypothetical protein